MSFMKFKSKVTHICTSVHVGVKFENRGDKFIAICSDGTQIEGTPGGRSMTVTWGNVSNKYQQHQAMVTV